MMNRPIPSDSELELLVIAIQALRDPDTDGHQLNAVDRGRELLREALARWGKSTTSSPSLTSLTASMPELSPAAQAIIGGYMKDQYGRISTYAQHNLANALLAAADSMSPDWNSVHCITYLRAIAAELEGNLPEFLDSSACAQ